MCDFYHIGISTHLYTCTLTLLYGTHSCQMMRVPYSCRSKMHAHSRKMHIFMYSCFMFMFIIVLSQSCKCAGEGDLFESYLHYYRCTIIDTYSNRLFPALLPRLHIILMLCIPHIFHIAYRFIAAYISVNRFRRLWLICFYYSIYFHFVFFSHCSDSFIHWHHIPHLSASESGQFSLFSRWIWIWFNLMWSIRYLFFHHVTIYLS